MKAELYQFSKWSINYLKDFLVNKIKFLYQKILDG